MIRLALSTTGHDSDAEPSPWISPQKRFGS